MMEPGIGIWWDNGVEIAALVHSISENSSCSGPRIDSDLSHADDWPRVAGKLGRSVDDEYFCVPRGRVQLDVRSNSGIILHGPATDRRRLELIAKRFGLETWRAELDTHYYHGADADRLFDDVD